MRSPALVSETHRGSNSELFELELELPNKRLTDIAGGLIGFAERHARMKAMLRLLLDRDGLETWSKKHYGKRIPLIEVVSDRYPLAVFHGDVGTGKTATAEASSNASSGAESGRNAVQAQHEGARKRKRGSNEHVDQPGLRGGYPRGGEIEACISDH